MTAQTSNRGRKGRARRRRAAKVSRPLRQRWTPVASNSPLIEETIAHWQPLSRRVLTREDAREMIENISGFFAILLEWDEAERQCTSSKESTSADRELLQERNYYLAKEADFHCAGRAAGAESDSEERSSR